MEKTLETEGWGKCNISLGTVSRYIFQILALFPPTVLTGTTHWSL